MKTYTIDDIRALDPCYDPTEYAPEDWTGTLLDILNAENVPTDDRIWVVTGLLDDRTNRLFAVWCAREELKRVANPDPRSVNAVDVAERYANGKTTAAELEAAREAAFAASDAAFAELSVSSDESYAAWDAARAAVNSTSSNAAWAAAYTALAAVKHAASELDWSPVIEKLKRMVEK